MLSPHRGPSHVVVELGGLGVSIERYGPSSVAVRFLPDEDLAEALAESGAVLFTLDDWLGGPEPTEMAHWESAEWRELLIGAATSVRQKELLEAAARVTVVVMARGQPA